ncbi:nucleotidyltransferase domain-containing protein [Curtobacterium sp. MCBD17_028]|nr:nucleotidyltransferase domain-containing protein [Curtobacterium sp. MCBD17_028]
MPTGRRGRRRHPCRTSRPAGTRCRRRSCPSRSRPTRPRTQPRRRPSERGRAFPRSCAVETACGTPRPHPSSGSSRGRGTSTERRCPRCRTDRPTSRRWPVPDLRAVPSSLDSSVVAEIDARLARVETEHGVAVAWAIESGSRAWGFPSPDSDYDCRFLFVRPRHRYLALWPDRDVIETPLDAVFDVNGWDLAKTVRLLVRGNAVAIEWLRSPIVYRGDEGFRDRMLGFAGEVMQRGAIGRHYLHVARQQQTGSRTLKRFCYVLRCATTLRWLDDHPDGVLPPMDLPTLLDETTVSAEVRDASAALIAAKAVTRELGTGAPPTVLQRYVDEELERSASFDQLDAAADVADRRARAEAFFRAEVERVH